MKTIYFDTIAAISFGANNYTFGLEAIVFDPKHITIEEVKKLDGVYLHPTEKPNSMEIFALYGNDEQFHQFYNEVAMTWAIKESLKEIGNLPDIKDWEAWSKLSDRQQEIIPNFKAWYDVV